MNKVSAVLITLNEEQRIQSALECLTWADEVVVLDFESKDRTVEICNRYADRVVQEPWIGFVRGRNRSFELVSHPWILTVDADEHVTEELRDEIREALDLRTDGGTAGFMIPRKTRYMGRWINHCGWYPDQKLRLAFRDRAKWVGGAVHEKCVVEGPVRTLKNPLLHYSFDDLGHHVSKLNYYSDLYAQHHFENGKNISLLSAFFALPGTFIKKYFIKLGFLDGIPGFTVSALSAMTMYLKKMKLRELHRKARQSTPDAARVDGHSAGADERP